MENNVVASVEGESKDWINELPDCILSYIFSLLIIKDAVESTIMVCRRWRNLWKTRSPNLELDIANIFGSKYAAASEDYERNPLKGKPTNEIERACYKCYKKRMSYIKRVVKVLELLSCNKLDSFKVAFFFDRDCTDLLDKWVRFAIEKGAQKLDLRLSRGPGSRFGYELYAFPHSILAELNVSTLKELILNRCILNPAPTDFDRFLQLTNLCLRSVEVGQEFSAHLFSTCSLLESLTLKWCEVGSDLIIGPSVHLHDLKVLDCRKCYSLTDDSELRIEIDAVNLVSLEYSRCKMIRMRTPKLVSFFHKDENAFPNVLTQLTSSPELSTLHITYKEFPQDFPPFKNLKQVKLDILGRGFEIERILDIIKDAPFMEELVMTLENAYYRDDERNLPTFSHNHLRRVKIQNVSGEQFEIDLVICILQIAVRLELVVMDPVGSLYRGDGMWDDIATYFYTPYALRCHRNKDRAHIKNRLKDIKTNAQVVIL